MRLAQLRKVFLPFSRWPQPGASQLTVTVATTVMMVLSTAPQLESSVPGEVSGAGAR